MTNSGKVLHLYVEVRPVPDEERAKLKDIKGAQTLMVHKPDIFPESQHGALNTPCSLVPPPVDERNVGSNSQGIFTSKSPFDLHINPGGEGQAPLQTGVSLSHDEMYQLLSALQPELKRGTGNLKQTRSTENEPFCGRESRIYGHFTAPPTPSGARKTYGELDKGKLSIATFSYIKKANIRYVGGHPSIFCQNKPENPFRKSFNDQTISFHCHENFSNSLGLNGQESFCNSNSNNILTGSVIKPKDNISLQRMRIARNSTHHALKEFGSPQLRPQLVTANYPDRCYGTLHRLQPRCHSWSGSPVVTRVARTLPAYTHPVDLYQHKSPHGIPRSPAAHKLSSDAGQHHFISCSANAQFQAIPNPQEWKSDETLKQEYKHSSVLPSSRPTAIQHQIPYKNIIQSPHKQTGSQKTSPQQNNKINFSLTSLSNGPAPRGNKVSVETNILSASSASELTPNFVEEATNLIIHLEDRKPSLNTVKSESARSGQLNTEEFSTRTYPESNIVPQDEHWANKTQQKSVKTQRSSGWGSPHLSFSGGRALAFCSNLHQVGVMSTSSIQEPCQQGRIIQGMNSPVSYQHSLPQYTGENSIQRQEDRHCDAGNGCGLGDSPDAVRPCTQFNSNIPVKTTLREPHFSRVKENTTKENTSEVGVSFGMPLGILSKEEKMT
ncbi:uncharacterized protein LOC124403023 isoform X1 [Silurus meridionalis]|uniref:uncharacterized protein LOC124403023 isoform X1 n=2 Tax=Silurus meridionalis TaxID=175797 RepID=UPI001EECAD7C|nr:uncharacterized protein LOC124403023 isoform X1 [Silurus meridionalis]XP_046732521.1 uncharacterized protein LOC124403023 isoform X1 [Silurus meridionalis]